VASIDERKQLIYDLLMKDRIFEGDLGFSRWKPVVPDPIDLNFNTIILPQQTQYAYQSSEPGIVEWYVNFADPQLFVAYGTDLFAQDEMQVAEHPILAHLKEGLLCIYRTSDVNYSYKPSTVDTKMPTPILITGADRVGKIHTGKAPGLPNGLYGNHFAKAPFEAIKNATQVFENPTQTNLICMSALKASWGRYTLDQIEYLLTTAYTSFKAAHSESLRLDNSCQIHIHTGNWGCGAFGGNLELTALLQLVAAKAAKINTITYHTFNTKGTEALNRGIKRLESLNDNCTFSELCNIIIGMEYYWGVSNNT